MFTSGTTSLPKGVMLRYGDFSAYVTANVELADGTPRGAALLCAPLYHIAGATNMMTTLWTGRKLVLQPQFEPRAWLDLVERETITHAFVVPTMMKQILDQPDLRQRDLSSLEVLSYGGAQMPFPVIRRAIETLPEERRLRERVRPDRDDVHADGARPRGPPARRHGRRDRAATKRLKSIGRPLPDVEVRSSTRTGSAARRRGRRDPRPHAARDEGLRGREDSPFTADGWLPTRDIGWMDEDGYLYVAGRKDDMIIRGGENIAPAEVEAVLVSHPAVEEAAVVGVPDDEWGQRVAAFVALRPARGHGGGARRVLPRAPRELQEARGVPLPRRAAEEPDGQDPPARAARAVTARRADAAVVTRVEGGIARLALGAATRTARRHARAGALRRLRDAGARRRRARRGARSGGKDFSLGCPTTAAGSIPRGPTPSRRSRRCRSRSSRAIDGEARRMGLRAWRSPATCASLTTRAVLSRPDASGAGWPAAGSRKRLPRMIGASRAAACLLLGTRIGPARRSRGVSRPTSCRRPASARRRAPRGPSRPAGRSRSAMRRRRCAGRSTCRSRTGCAWNTISTCYCRRPRIAGRAFAAFMQRRRPGFAGR
jgi:acyl-CoA synthetase (AMP-forming)/AMP-acid ligase II